MYLLRVVAVSSLVLLTTAAQARDVSKSEVCATTSEQQIASLFDRWNASLQTGEPKKVVANYSDKSILLPTPVSYTHLTLPTTPYV